MGSTANSPSPSFKSHLHRGTLKIWVFSGRTCVSCCSGAGSLDRNAEQFMRSSTGNPEHKVGLYSGMLMLLKPLTHHGGEPTLSHILPVLLLSATLSVLCGKVNQAGDVLFQPKAIAKMADKTHKHFNELFVIKVWKLQVLSCSFFFF